MATSTLGNGTLVLAGTTSGTTTVTATAVAGTTTLTLPAATDTLVGRATTDTLTNKTLTGAAMNGTLGATTPSTGAFTTLTSTGASSFATSSGDVGIGTSSPNSKLQVNSGTNLGGVLIGFNGGSSNFYDADAQYWRTGDGTERMRLDSSGNLLVGTTSQIASGFVCLSFANNVRNGIVINDTDTGSGTSAPMIFRRNGSQVGSITTTTTSTAYVTSSDYRLKENIVPMADALSVVAQLKPCTYTWKSNGSSGQGFIAHELQAVVPDAVVGKKDAVDEDGNPKYQGIDTSFLVATLTAAIQELKAEFDAYKASHP